MIIHINMLNFSVLLLWFKMLTLKVSVEILSKIDSIKSNGFIVSRNR